MGLSELEVTAVSRYLAGLVGTKRAISQHRAAGLARRSQTWLSQHLIKHGLPARIRKPRGCKAVA